MVPNTVEICTAAPSSNILITFKAIESEKVSPSDMIFVKILMVDGRYSFLNKNNLK